ncbi:hypothetical protein [Methanohalobium sp.]|uniref:hypothetical protein n=1 Tax=Methanohalobium sp. TaxID=2837493 RepID=UPI0025E5A0D8|nr:hypothetical protein [Methanohalobium sp.]
MATVMSGQKLDRVPVVPFILGYAANMTGISLGDFYADGNKCFDAQHPCVFMVMNRHQCMGMLHVEHGN